MASSTSFKDTSSAASTDAQQRLVHSKAMSILPTKHFPNISSGGTPSETSNVRVENLIGFAKVPIGLGGPLTVHGENQQNKVFAPLATVEATLVASCSRGCKAFESSGGIHAVALSEGMSRAPVFCFASPVDAVFFYRRIPGLEKELRDWAEGTSRFAKLEKVVPHLLGKNVHVRFVYTCGDASGQNMSTIATHMACQKLLAARGVELKIIDFLLEGQMASDKKLASIHVYEPRGVQVFAWGVLSDSVCRTILGNSAARIHGALAIAQQGAVRAGMMGSNINVANVLAAMFIACGQDAASVLESGWAQLTSQYDIEREELTLSLFIPSLPLGSVGGGTMYSTQKEALEILQCAGDGRKWALAETMAAFALALGVSTASAMADDTFAKSHERFARSSKM